MSPALTFVAGLLLCNCIPHLASGLQGMPFPTPFAKPRGVGDSPPLVNVLWGACNLFAGVFVLRRSPGIALSDLEFVTLAAGFVLAGAYLSSHFAKVRSATGQAKI